jgi:hypothetical protein
LALNRFLKLSKNGKNAKFRGRPSVKLGKNGKNAKFRSSPMGKLSKNGKNAKFEVARKMLTFVVYVRTLGYH